MISSERVIRLITTLQLLFPKALGIAVRNAKLFQKRQDNGKSLPPSTDSTELKDNFERHVLSCCVVLSVEEGALIGYIAAVFGYWDYC